MQLVELRVGAGHPIKAKYIKVELRKIEIIPGGGPTNTFTDIGKHACVRFQRVATDAEMSLRSWKWLFQCLDCQGRVGCHQHCTLLSQPYYWHVSFFSCSQQDIPFNIRIPDNVPPSVALENGGGIRYELAAEICIKTKK